MFPENPNHHLEPHEQLLLPASVEPVVHVGGDNREEPPTSEVIPESPAEIDEAKFSISSVAKCLNPARAARGYGRFLKRTVKEFGLAEVNGTITAVGAGYIAHKHGPEAGNAWITATAGSLGEGVGFYGTSFVQRFRQLRGDKEVPYNRREAAAESGRYLVGAFALAEAVDTPTRPVAMWAFPKVADSLGFGVGTAAGLLGGKLVADHIYYGVAVPSSDAYHRRAAVRKAKKAQSITKSLQ